MTLKKSIVLILLIIIIDQTSKIYIKTHFTIQESVDVFSWFKIYFLENEGMAWGTKIPGEYGKLFLTVFRIFAVFGIIYWLINSFKNKASNYLTVAISLIFAGAVGNIIDSVFYGVIFNDSYHSTATLFSNQPYGTFFHGKVVDMFYFPFIENGQFPDWMPIIGGNYFTFFNAVFNVADFAISVGIGILIVFNKKAFNEIETKKETIPVQEIPIINE
jgi:signal peptidase II